MLTPLCASFLAGFLQITPGVGRVKKIVEGTRNWKDRFFAGIGRVKKSTENELEINQKHTPQTLTPANTQQNGNREV